MWAEDLIEALGEKERPENSYSAQDFAKRTGRSVQHCGTILRQMMAKGKLKRVLVDREYFYYDASEDN